jgi:hypothetical protein
MQKIRSKPKNLNSKSSEYIQENILKQNPDGLPSNATVPMEDEIVIARYIPEMKRIQFINGRDPGYPLDFHYHSKTHPLKHYTLYHGKEYDLSVEIIEHLEGCAERQYGYRQGPNGHPEMYVKGLKYNFRCQPVKRSA